jgi:MFS family permease
MTAAAVAGLAGNLAFAPLIDRVDRRTAIVVTLSVMTLAALASALAPSFPALAATYAAVGLGGITLMALIIACAGDLYVGPLRGHALGWILFGNMGVGLVLLPLLSFLADRAGWPVAFYGFSVLAALTTISARSSFFPATCADITRNVWAI